MNSLATLLLTNVVYIASIGAAEPRMKSIDAWSNTFSGVEVSQRFLVKDGVAVGKAVGWRAALETAVIARRETMVKADANGDPSLTVQFQLPGGEPKTVLPVSIFATNGGQEILVKRLWVFPRNPFAQPIPLLGVNADNELVLFDPKRKTRTRLDEIQLKYRAERNIEALSELHAGVLLVGEGISFREHRGLPNILVQAAARGVKVICLAPSAGGLVLPGDDDQQAGMRSISLRKSDIISDFDKHLDVLDWRGESPVVSSSLMISGKANAFSVDISTEQRGWPWLEAEFPGDGRLIVCGLGIIELWDAGPSPRHCFWHLLAHAVREPLAPLTSTPRESAAPVRRSGPREE